MLGLNWFDIERLPYGVFRAWASELDKVAKDREQQARRARHG